MMYVVECKGGETPDKELEAQDPEAQKKVDEVNEIRVNNKEEARSDVNRATEKSWSVLENNKRSRLSSSIDPLIIEKMIKTMKNAGEDGVNLANRIEKGAFEGIEGYITLIKKSSSDYGTLKAVNQAIDKADELITKGTSKASLRFEDNPIGVYDIDLGIKDPNKVDKYLEGYQFKTNTAPLSTSSIQGASSQLMKAPCNKRIVEFKLVETDNIADIQSNKKLIHEFQHWLHDKGLKPTNNVIIDEFHLILKNRTKVKVIWKNGVVFKTL